MNHRRETSVDDLQRLGRVKTIPPKNAAALGQEMIEFFKQAVTKRQGKLAKLAEAWGELVPDSLSAHCSLESFSKGTLIVLVDSSSHLYQLKQLLLTSLEGQLLLKCKSAGLRKINLKAGRWYAEGEERKVRFDSR